jgi:sn-glycerol 3-phosphate transport system ATP-binding protein/multiple sugar transport system ATP-binding protein
VRKLSKAFDQTTVLADVSLSIPSGNFTVLVGASGCGKSTLLRTVAGLEAPTSGSIWMGGRDVTALSPKDRDIAMVFQSYALYPHLSVRENLAFGLRLRRTPDGEIAARVAEASTMLGLDLLLDRLPRQLSGGQRQRVAMGRAIVRRPQMFLFDEPLSNLDASLRAEVRVEIRGLHDRMGGTTLYVTHDQVEAMTLADTLCLLRGGAIEQVGAPLALFDHPVSRFAAEFLGSPKINWLDGQVTHSSSSLRIDVGTNVLEVPERYGKLSEQPVLVGLRPHHLTVASEGAPQFANMTVTFCEAMGFETYVHGTLSGVHDKTVVMRVEPSCHVAKGDTLPIGIRPEHTLLFNPRSERALDAPS